MHCLLLGNGLNRLSLQVNWKELLACIAKEMCIGEVREISPEMPFSLYFEELCSYESSDIVGNEISIKKKISNHLEEIEWHSLHMQYVELFDTILTSNYDYTLEKSTGPFRTKLFDSPESKFSIFRHTVVEEKNFWHIHGELLYPQSLLLGYDQYIGYVNRIKNYIANESPLGQGKRDFENIDGVKYSWVDHFLRDDLHIVGLGLDFTEIDLWWLLVNKARRKKVGKTFYYQVEIGNGLNTRKREMLESFGVSVEVIKAVSYIEGYSEILELIKRKVTSVQDVGEEAESAVTDMVQYETRKVRQSNQLPLHLTNRRKRKK